MESLPAEIVVRSWRTLGLGTYRGLVTRLVPFAALILVVAFFSVVGGENFLSLDNGSFLLQQSAVIAIPAFGVTLVIIAGSIDLSVGSVVALTGMVAAVVSESNGVVAGIGAGILTGVAAGLANGLGFAVLRVPSFIVTLGMLSVARGLTIVVSQSQPVDVSPAFQTVGKPPGIFIVFAALFIVVSLTLGFTSFGRQAIAIGGQERVARLSGVPIMRMKIFIFVFSGLMAGLGGVLLAARVGAATPTSATGFELTAIAAVVLGGTPLTGGVGNMTSTVVGAFILSILLNGMIIMGVPGEIQLIVQGLVLVGAVLLSLERSKIGIIK
ncbi:MAG TPA: ABC transporter permease [Candidatus Dormibacteraeota bacterium]|nr:ABC transporter permease [Candidatus Dormibacteraeota bacterium]